MNISDDKAIFRMSREFTERVNSLLSDGYRTRSKFSCNEFAQIRLHHMSNGNDIVIKADFRTMTITQWTNKIITHIQVYQQDQSDA